MVKSTSSFCRSPVLSRLEVARERERSALICPCAPLSMSNFSSQLLVLRLTETPGPQQARRSQPSLEFLNSSPSYVRCHRCSKSYMVVLLAYLTKPKWHSIPLTSRRFPGEDLVPFFIGQVSCFSKFSNSLSSWLLCLFLCLRPESIKMWNTRFSLSFTSDTTHESRYHSWIS